MKIVYVALLCLPVMGAQKSAGVQHKVHCSSKEMRVEMMLPSDVHDVYLEGMKDYGKELGCQPTLGENTAIFRLSLVDFTRCAMTKIVDQSNGRRNYHHRIVVESDSGKESILVKCGWMSTRVHRRDVLSDDFQEEEDLDIIPVEGRAPEPILGIGVRQNGKLIGADLNVQPGTLLQMDIYLDPNSTSTYGLRVSYMDVTDRKTKEETIILNGCSVDPYLFENFNTVDGDSVTARFRAFKFPESNFVLFRGTIDVCLDTCAGVECSNDQIAYGRKKRSPKPMTGNDKVFQVSMATVVKFDADPALQKDTLESKSTSRIERQEPESAPQEPEPAPEPEPEPSPEPQPEPSAEPQPEPAAEPKSLSQNSAVNVQLPIPLLILTSWILIRF